MPGTVYTVASGKGGVGKTTTSVNLAVALWREGNAVALVDADIGMANLAAVLDLEPEETLHDVLAGRATVEEAVIEAKDGDLMVLPGDRSLDSFADADPAALRDVVSDLAGRADYVIVDTGAGLSYEDVLPLGMADGVILVTTPDPAAFGDTMKTMEVAELLDAPIRGLVVTRAVEDTNTGAIAAEIGAELLGAIPEDPAVMASTVAGDPLESHAPDAEAAAAYRDLATAVIEGDEEWLEEHAPEPAAVASAGAAEPTGSAGTPDATAAPEEGEGGADEGRDATAEPDAAADEADVGADEDVEADEASEGAADEPGEEPAEPDEEPAQPEDAEPGIDEAIGDDDRDAREAPEDSVDDPVADAEAEPGDDSTAGGSADPADDAESGPTASAETEEAATETDDDATADEAEVGDEIEESDEDALDEEGDEAGVDDEDDDGEDGDDADVDDDAAGATVEDAEASEEASDEDDASEDEAPEEGADDEPETEERRGGFFGWLGRLFS